VCSAKKNRIFGASCPTSANADHEIFALKFLASAKRKKAFFGENGFYGEGKSDTKNPLLSGRFL
jgi:hypothetical protein